MKVLKYKFYELILNNKKILNNKTLMLQFFYIFGSLWSNMKVLSGHFITFKGLTVQGIYYP